MRGEGDAHPRRGLADAGGELQKPEADGRELGLGQRVGLGDGGAYGEDQPISGGVQDEPHLIGERRAAAGAVGGELGLVQLDQVLGLAARAVETGIEPLGGAGADVGDDVADIETVPRRLDACGDAARSATMTWRRSVVSAKPRTASMSLDRAPTAHGVGGVLDLGGQDALPDRPKNEADIVRVAPVHHLRPAVVAVAADGDLRVGQCRRMRRIRRRR